MVRIGMILSDRYEIQEKIGSGGMADVYKAKDLKLNRAVAIKVLKQEYSSDRNFVSKFWSEAQSAACLTHPNIVAVYDVGNDQGIYYIVMELVEGITLKKYIEKKGKLEIRESIGIAMQVCQGIEAAHEQKIIHRDIKPQNIIISREGKIKVTDFGIARAASSQTISSNAMGSVHYISPEQARGGYCDERSDIYSLGIVMYEMLTGVVPFDGESTVQVALMHIQSEMVPPSKYEPMIPVSLEKIILKCTQKKPEARYQSVSALITDLRRALMTPDEDFVKIAPIVNSNDPTRIMSEEEVSQIKNEVNNSAIPPVDEDEEAYLRGYEDEDYDDDYDDDDDDDNDDDEDDDEDETDSRFEHIITYISIAVAVLIIILMIWIVIRAFGLFGGNSDSSDEEVTDEEYDGTKSAMPNVIGMTMEEAEAVLKDLDLDVSWQYESSALYPDNYVISQEFEEGTMVNKHYKVLLTVSDNSAYTEIPSGLIGMTYSEARSALLAVGLVPEVEYEYSDYVDADIVMDVEPYEGTQVMKTDTVTLTVSQGPTTVAVPDVRNNTEAVATDTLQKLGFNVISDSAYSDDVAAGYVISMSASAGTQMEVGSSITIVVSKGSNKVTVPNLLDKTLEQASTALENVGLVLSSSYETGYSSSISKDHVMEQSIESGTTVEMGTSVTVTLSLGVEKVTVPSLDGYIGTSDTSGVSSSISNAGLTPTISTSSEYNDTVSSGCIISISCDPGSGSSVDKGSTVTVKIVISDGPEPTQSTEAAAADNGAEGE